MLMLRVLCLSGLLGAIPPAVAQGFPELPSTIGAWHAVGSAERHAGEGLYAYMDGGAELYLEHGFQELMVRFYERRNDQISVEIYRMKNSGYGIFTVLRSENGEAVSIADAGFRSGYYVIFASGNHLCAITAQSEFPDAAQAAVEIAKAVAATLPPIPVERQKTEPLPEEGRLLNSEKIIAGPISLRSVSDALAACFGGFSEGAAARYRTEKETAVLAGFLRWPTASQAATAFRKGGERAAKQKDFRARSAKGEVSFYDFEGKSGIAVVSGNRVLFAIAKESASARNAVNRMLR